MKTLPGILFLALAIPAAYAAKDIPVPAACTPAINQPLEDIIHSGSRANVDNVMVCGTTIRKSRTQYGGPHGDHQVLALKVMTPDGQSFTIEVVTNDELDGVVNAPAEATVFAYGQAFVPRRGQYDAGVHDVHCSTHATANNGWVVVNGARYPTSCPGRY